MSGQSCFVRDVSRELGVNWEVIRHKSSVKGTYVNSQIYSKNPVAGWGGGDSSNLCLERVFVCAYVSKCTLR